MIKMACWCGLFVLSLTSAGCSREISDANETLQPLRIVGAKVREIIPGTDKTVGYFELVNDSDKHLVLVNAVAQNVRAIEIHETSQQGGVSRMRRLPELSVDPHSRLVFETGGKHLMLFGVTELSTPLQIELLFDDGSSLAADFEVFGLLDQP